MNMEELKGLSKEELKEKLDEAEMELIKLRGEAATGTNPENPSQIKNYKRTIARIKTIL